jgi:hypothetical protein
MCFQALEQSRRALLHTLLKVHPVWETTMARVILALFLWLSVALPSAIAAPIALNNTGVDAGGNLVALGEETNFWTLLSAPVGATEPIGSNAFRFRHPSYAADTLTSAWVSMAASGNASVFGVYVYALEVDLTGIEPNSVLISGQFSTDNDGFIRVNGGPTAATTGFSAFGSLHNFALSSGFVAGINTIEVGVNNGGNPTAFHVLFSTQTSSPINGTPRGSVPEPGALLLVALGLAGVAFARRGRSFHKGGLV